MARRYSKVERFVWKDVRFRALDRDARELWLYLLTAPDGTSCAGLIPVSRLAMLDDLQWLADPEDPEAIAEAFARLKVALDALNGLGWVEVDHGARLVLVPKAIAHNLPDSPNAIYGWCRVLREIPDSPLKRHWIDAARAAIVAAEEGTTGARLAMFEACEADRWQGTRSTRAMIQGGRVGPGEPSKRGPDRGLKRGPTVTPGAPPKELGTGTGAGAGTGDPSIADPSEIQTSENIEGGSGGSPGASTAGDPGGSGSTKTEKVHRDLVDWFCVQLRAVKPDCKLPTPSVRERWADTFRLMVQRDGRTPRRIAEVIRFATRDEFWAANIRSAGKLREKFDTLELAMRRGAGSTAPAPAPPPEREQRQRKLESYLEDMQADATRPEEVPDLDAYLASRKGADAPASEGAPPEGAAPADGEQAAAEDLTRTDEQQREEANQ
jgi:hypothetical protein